MMMPTYHAQHDASPDVTILADDGTAFNVHAVILSKASPVFKAMLQGNFKVNKIRLSLKLIQGRLKII